MCRLYALQRTAPFEPHLHLIFHAAIQHTPILKIRLQNFLLWIWHELPSARCRGVSLQRLYTREIVARLATAMGHYAGWLSYDCGALGSFSMQNMWCVHFYHLGSEFVHRSASLVWNLFGVESREWPQILTNTSLCSCRRVGGQRQIKSLQFHAC